jgi:hypothetical protein
MEHSMVIIKQLTPIALGVALAATAVTPSVAQRSPAGPSREQAVRDCNATANRFTQHIWGDFEIDTYRACMAQRGQQE